MLGMYLFSMPGEEATILAGSDRYVKTILIAILYVAVIVFMKILTELNMRKGASVAAAARCTRIFLRGRIRLSGRREAVF